MPSILYLGGRLDSVDIIAGAPVEITTAAHINSTYTAAAIRLYNTTTIECKLRDSSNTPTDLTTGQTGYFHYDIGGESTGQWGSSTTSHAALVDSSGNPWLALRPVSTTALGIYYNSGTGGSPTWTQIGSSTVAWSSINNSRATFDIKITLGSPHSVEWSLNGTLVQSGTFTQASLTAIRALRLTGGGFYNAISQIMATEGRSTINGFVPTKRATGAGGNSGWTGAYTNVNEAVNSDGTVDSTTTAGVRQTYAIADVTVPAGYAIQSVWQWLRAKNDGAAPSNIKSVVRQSTTNYDYATNMPGIGTSFGSLPARYDTDPASAAAWTQTTFNSAEFGYLSAT